MSLTTLQHTINILHALVKEEKREYLLIITSPLAEEPLIRTNIPPHRGVHFLEAAVKHMKGGKKS